MSETPQNTSRRMTRRQFLKGLGITTGVLVVGVALGAPTIVKEGRLVINNAFLTGDAPMGKLPDTPFVWFKIDADNTAHLYIPKIEMGQGIHTSLAQIAADGLEVDWENVRVHQADTETGFDPDLIFTFGSTSITSLYQPTREAAATMRLMLRTEAAAQLNANLDEIAAEHGACFLKNNPDSRLSYGEIISAKQGDWVLPEGDAPLKSPAEFRYIGQSIQRVDFESKLRGEAIYGFDARLPEMLYGAIARPPRYGAKLIQASAGTAAEQAGVVQVVLQEGFAGIVAQTRSQAYAALSHLELTWDGGTTMGQAEIESFVSVPTSGGDGILIQREGDFAQAIQSGTVVEAQYRTPMAAHAHLEPQGALVSVLADKVIVYASTQSPLATREAIAAATGLEAAIIAVYPTYLGGSFGRKTGEDVAVEAALLSKASGKPVHVGWNRTEEMRYGYRRPPAHNVLRASVDESGQITAIEHQVASADVLFYKPDGSGGGFLERLLGADPLAAYGALIHYTVPNIQVIYHHRRIPVPTAFWRGLGSFPNTFAVETFIDEIAEASGQDPLTMRLNHLPNDALGERMRNSLNTVAEAANWSSPSAEGRAKGLAMCYDRKSVVALIVEVSVENNKIRVHEAWCAVDPGLVVNPNGAAAQVEGSIVMALSSTLFEKITVENGMVLADNFQSYPLITMRDTPNIHVFPLSSSDTPLGGLGEPVVGAVPAAVSNAIFALTGQRLRELPLTLA
jgi:isoquinoline 1-oxidoreductase beta subunit